MTKDQEALLKAYNASRESTAKLKDPISERMINNMLLVMIMKYINETIPIEQRSEDPFCKVIIKEVLKQKSSR